MKMQAREDARANSRSVIRWELQYERKSKREIVEAEARSMDTNGDLSIVWLFLPTEVGFRVLCQIGAALSKRSKRANARDEWERSMKHHEAESMQMAFDLNLLWPFLPTATGFKMLKQVELAISKRSERAKAQDESYYWSYHVDDAKSGAWLFQHEAQSDSLCHLMHTYQRCGSTCPRCQGEWLDESDCLGSILNLFPPVGDCDCIYEE